MNDAELRQLSDLPTHYVEALCQRKMVPLWPSLRGVLPPEKPRPNTRATAWAYRDIKPLLLQAGQRTPIEEAERRAPRAGAGQPGPRAGQDAGQRRHLPGHAVAAARRMSAVTPLHAQRGAHGG